MATPHPETDRSGDASLHVHLGGPKGREDVRVGKP